MFFLMALFQSCISAGGIENQYVTVSTDFVNEEMIYQVNSKSISYPDILNHLHKLYASYGEYPSVLVLIHQKTPMNIVSNLKGLIGKLGYKEIRYFYYGRGSDMMGEFEFKTAIPFSRDPSGVFNNL